MAARTSCAASSPATPPRLRNRSRPGSNGATTSSFWTSGTLATILALNLGLRYELPKVPYSPSGLANALSPDGTSLVPATTVPEYKFTNPNHNQWAPRVGVAYRSRGIGSFAAGSRVSTTAATMNAHHLPFLNPPFSTNFYL